MEWITLLVCLTVAGMITVVTIFINWMNRNRAQYALVAVRKQYKADYKEGRR